MKRILFGLLLAVMMAGNAWCASITRYVNTDNVGSVDGLTEATGYTTLASAEDALDGTSFGAGETCTINCSGTTADTTPVVFAGWDADVTINIIGNSDGSKWDTTKYRLTVSGDTQVAFRFDRGNIDVSKFQLQITQTVDFNRGYGFYIGQNIAGTVSIHECIVLGTSTTNRRQRGLSDGSGATGLTLKVRNNIFANFIDTAETCEAIGIIYGTGYFDNNTFYNCGVGIGANTGTYVARNNLFASCSTNASGTFSAGTDYNITDDASIGYTVTGSGNTHDHTSHTFTFTSTTSTTTGFLHLASNDSGAKDLGYDLTSDANNPFSIDIDGVARSSTWDSGADEYVDSGTGTESFGEDIIW